MLDKAVLGRGMFFLNSLDQGMRSLQKVDHAMKI